MKIGDYEVHSVQTGLFKLDGGAMFGVVPKNLWERTNPSDEKNRIEMCARALLLDSGKKKVLIDTGIGNKMPERLNQIYAVDNSKYTLDSSLKELGCMREDITDVIISHLHFDHAGGSTFYDEDKQLKVAFPNAVYHVQKEQYEWALNPSDRDRASYFPENYKLLEDKKVLNLLNGEHKFDGNVTLLPVNGHTKDMQMIKISDGDNTLLYLADLIPTAGHIPLPYIMGYDLFPLMTLDEKKKYLKDVSENNWMVFFEHDPYNECATVGLGAKGYNTKECFSVSEK
ncbi:MAG: MBL fold metallo-hydrolase [Ignavibacteria bacterium]|nr:MBL fold metallo-hydrolase [Ignavibacteria bacterium]